jgi:hypothetical protein
LNEIPNEVFSHVAFPIPSFLLIVNQNMSSGAPPFCNMGAEQGATSPPEPNPEERKQS